VLRDFNTTRIALSLLAQVKLVIGIEDPRAKERREELGVEDESGVSREDLQYCLQEVKDGDMPEDRVALRRLAEEMREWPYLDLTDEMKAQAAEAGSSYASITNTGVQVCHRHASPMRVRWTRPW